MFEQHHAPHPAWSHWTAVISSAKMKPNVEFGGTWCPQNPLLTPAHFSAKLRINFNLAKKVKNATSAVFDPEHWEGQAEEGCCNVLVLSLPSPWDKPRAPHAAFQHPC